MTRSARRPAPRARFRSAGGPAPTRVHSLPLEVAVSAGIPGLLLFLSVPGAAALEPASGRALWGVARTWARCPLEPSRSREVPALLARARALAPHDAALARLAELLRAARERWRALARAIEAEPGPAGGAAEHPGGAPEGPRAVP